MKEFDNQYNANDFIDLASYFKKIYYSRIFILKFSVIALLFGLVISVSIPNKYSSSSTFIPQLTSSSAKPGGSSLSSLASLAGINLNNLGEQSSEISPILYPQILSSIPFKLELLSSKIIYNQKPIILRDFLIEYNKNFFTDIINRLYKFPSSIFKSNKEKSDFDIEIYKISEQDEKLFKLLDELLLININDKEGFITLSLTLKDQNIPPQIIKNAQTILQDKIISYKTQSSKDFLNFTDKQYISRNNELNNLQDKIAIFKDQNININSSLFQNRLSRLESQERILQAIVQQLATQVEQAKLQVNKDTPVFTIIKPVSIPFKKSKPSRSFIVLSFLFFGFTLACFLILTKDYLKAFFSEFKSSS